MNGGNKIIDNAPLGSFGNPIRCKGVEGEHDYLRRLVGPEGVPIEYRREGSLSGPAGHPYDVYTITYRGLPEPLRLFFDMYATGPRERRSPPGLFQIADFMKRQSWERPGYFMEVWAEKIGGDLSELPAQYAYVYSKAASLLSLGPYVYASLDCFGLPKAEWDTAAVVECAQQIVDELHGMTPSRPLIIRSIDAAANLLATFHFECSEECLPKPDERGLVKIGARHRVSHEMLYLHARIL